MDRKRAWTWILWVGAAVAILATPLFVMYNGAGATLEWHARDVRAKIAAIRERGSRPPILDDPLPGDAGEPFRSIQGSLGTLSRGGLRELGFLTHVGPGHDDKNRVREMVAKHAGAIDALRRYLRMSFRPPEQVYLMPPCGESFKDEPEQDILEALLGLSNGLYWIGRRRDALEGFLSCMAMSQEVLADSRQMREAYLGYEEQTASILKVIFEHCDSSAEELEFCAKGLDRLEARRLSLRDFLFVRDVVERSTVLQMVAGGPNPLESYPHGYQRTYFPRTWKTLYSERIAQARTLNEIADFYQELSSIDRLPPHQRGDAIEDAGGSWMGRAGWTRLSAREKGEIGIGHYQAAVDLQRLLVRVATALSWYRAATGADPKSLADLVPRYLSAVPISPVTGEPLGYADGTVTATDSDRGGLGGGAKWRIKRP